MVYFTGSNKPDCQEDEGINIANVGARTTIICQNEKDDANEQNGKTNPDPTNTDTDTANNGSKGKGFNYVPRLSTDTKIFLVGPNLLCQIINSFLNIVPVNTKLFVPDQKITCILYRH